MRDEYGMSVDDFHCEPKQIVLKRRPDFTSELPVTAGYTPALPRANLILVREHLQNAMRAGLNTEALRCVVQAIKEIER